MGKAFHKPPSVPNWVWLDTDGCWWCKYRRNQKGCTGCKEMKHYIADQKERRNRKEKQSLHLIKNII